MNNRLTKQIIYIVIGFILLITIAVSFNGLMFLNTRKTCATFYKIGTSRYVDYYHYSYFINGKKYDGSLTRKELKIKSLDSLKKIKCVEIEYSTYINSYSRVIDQRVVSEWVLDEFKTNSKINK